MIRKLTIALMAILIIGASSAYATAFSGDMEGKVKIFGYDVVFVEGYVTWSGILDVYTGHFTGVWSGSAYDHRTQQWINVSGWIDCETDPDDGYEIEEGSWGYSGNSTPAGAWMGDFTNVEGTWTDYAGGAGYGGTWWGEES